MPSASEEYFFDLRGYSVIEQAVDGAHLRAMNDWIDGLPALEVGQWLGPMEVHTYGATDGTNVQNIIEAGEIFERLIDHPTWMESARHYIGRCDRPFLHEAFLNLRGPGGYIGIHSGGHNIDHHQRTGRDRGQWVCSMLTLMLPLTDVGPGDGATTMIPGSHKSDFPHPRQDRRGHCSEGPGDDVEGAVAFPLKAGDALLFNDAVAHGSTRRVNAGERRMIVLRYVPSLLGHRFAYQPSEELLSRLTPERRAIVQPIRPRRRPADAAV